MVGGTRCPVPKGQCSVEHKGEISGALIGYVMDRFEKEKEKEKAGGLVRCFRPGRADLRLEKANFRAEFRPEGANVKPYEPALRQEGLF